MNYSEYHNSMLNRSLEHDNSSQYYQNINKSNRESKPNQDNTLSMPNDPCSRYDGHSSLNYNSAPFTPKQQPKSSNGNTHIPLDTGVEKPKGSNRLYSENDTNYYHQGPNINFDALSGNITNQCMYNSMDYMSYLYQMQNSSSWPIMQNNYYGLSNMGLSSNIEPNQNMFVTGKGPENSFVANNNFNSSIQTNAQQVNQKGGHTPHTMKQNNSSNLNPEAPAPGVLWSDTLSDKNVDNLSRLSLSKRNFTTSAPDSGQCAPLSQTSYSEILQSVSNQDTKGKLLEAMKNINPQTFALKSLSRARFFVIKSYSEDDLHRAIKYGVWCSTKSGNEKLNAAYKDMQTVNAKNHDVGRLFLFFSVNGSGFFAGVAEMIGPVNFREQCGFWSQNKWIGKLDIRWHYVKDVRNSSLRHIRSEANENKPVTNSRDTVEVTPFENGVEFIKVFHHAKHETSVFDDFEHYEQRESNPGLQ